MSAEPARPGVKRTRAARAAAWLVAAALVVLAAWSASRAGEGLGAAWGSLRSAPAWLVALLLALVTATPLTTSGVFWLLHMRHARLGFAENTALITGAWLLNFAPVSPGLLGRVAYLKMIRNVSVTRSAQDILWANLLSIVAGVILLAVLAGATAMGARGDGWSLAITAALPIALVACFAEYARRARPEPDPTVWLLLAALAVRFAELHLWGARYWVLFRVLDEPLAWGGALALAAVGTLASLFPLAPNGLGVREWAVGLVAPLLPVSLVFTASLTTPQSLTADLSHRAAEILVAIPLGLAALVWLGARIRRL